MWEEARLLYHTQVKNIARLAAFQNRVPMGLIGHEYTVQTRMILFKELENLQAPYIRYSMANPSFKIETFVNGTFQKAVEDNHIVVLENCDELATMYDSRYGNLCRMLETRHDIIALWDAKDASKIPPQIASRIGLFVQGPADRG